MVDKSVLVLCAAAMSFASPALGQAPAPHQHEVSKQLGTLDFPISCAAAAKPHFNRAVAWLHSFEYEEAERSFLRSAEADPHCAMSHWGVAMSQYHPLWAPPTPSELEKGRIAIARAGAIGGRSPRERAFISALAVFYANTDHVGHRERTFAYADAMERLYRLAPSDREAAVFYALSLVAAGMIDDDESFAREKKAAAILDAVLAVQLDHPGVAHYLIHSYDYPSLAHLALPAARCYAGIAPASAHAQHMPSHIFVRLGLWEAAVRSNLAAEASAQAYAKRMRSVADLDDATEKHPVTPGSILPAREQLAELLLEQGKAEEAMAEFERSLSRAPNRFTGLYGAARAAREAGDTERAARFFIALLDESFNGDGARPELDEARAFVASMGRQPCANRPSL